MTLRQRILKLVYPLWVGFSKLKRKKGKTVSPADRRAPSEPFHELSFVQNSGKTVSMNAFSGKKLLLVNTASDCGFTAQYKDLQQLYEANKDHLVVIGFPANDFKEQEKGNDEEIARFCQVNYGVTFPLAKKSTVLKAEDQNPVFRWLTHKELNGWNDRSPAWNFSKYLISEEGIFTHYFGPSVSPMSEEVMNAIKNS